MESTPTNPRWVLFQVATGINAIENTADFMRWCRERIGEYEKELKLVYFSSRDADNFDSWLINWVRKSLVSKP